MNNCQITFDCYVSAEVQTRFIAELYRQGLKFTVEVMDARTVVDITGY